MKATIEKVTRGTPEFPLDFIRQKGTLPDACITPLHYHNDLASFWTEMCCAPARGSCISSAPARSTECM